ncbi:MAG TPA: carboxypeptidase regulatory-like domain-containing protein [Pyrinomonadaceae bacterium]|nr:carboxypeptidase regulatory-like domain-containing protein [Pyrinomonadaceae bacterium]
MIPRFCRLLLSVFFLSVLAGFIQSKTQAQTDLPNQPTSPKIPVISGHVYRADTRAPIAKAKVILVPMAFSSNGQFQTVETRADGSFEFYDLRASSVSYVPKAAAEGFVDQDYSLDGTLEGKFLRLQPGVTFPNVNFYLPVAGVISGSISDERGTALKNIEVTAVHRKFFPGGDERPTYVMGTRTNADGTFQLKGLIPGSYLIVANGPNGNSVPGNDYSEVYYPNEASFKNGKPVTVSAGGETANIHISIKGEKRYTLSGKVTGPAAPDSNERYRYSISLEGRNGGYSMKDDGSFTMPGVPAGDYTMVAYGQDQTLRFVAFSRTPIHVGEGDTQVDLVVYRGGVISGRLVDSPSIQSLNNIRLALKSNDAAGSPLFDENGHFNVTILPGSYSFDLIKKDQPVYLKQVRCGGHDYTSAQLTVAPEQVIDDCEVVLADDVGVVKGQILNRGRSIPELTAVLIPERTELRKLPRYTTITKVAGDRLFTLANIIPGDYLLFIVPPTADEQTYFAPDFVDKHRAEAAAVKVAPRQTITVTITD